MRASLAADERALLRRALGVLTDLARLESEIRAILDAHVPAPCGNLARRGAVSVEEKARLRAEGLEWVGPCALPRGHRGRCGAVGQ
jgi:hypothetical protein